MDEVEVEEIEEDTGDRVSASVQHALRLVGPAEGGAERYWVEEQPVDSPARRARQ
jgi:hypothetical protein